jgi:hypothetical protein
MYGISYRLFKRQRRPVLERVDLMLDVFDLKAVVGINTFKCNGALLPSVSYFINSSFRYFLRSLILKMYCFDKCIGPDEFKSKGALLFIGVVFHKFIVTIFLSYLNFQNVSLHSMYGSLNFLKVR